MKKNNTIDKLAVKNLYEGEFIDLGSPDEILCNDNLFNQFLTRYEAVTKEKADPYSLKKTLLNLRKAKKLARHDLRHN